MRGASLIYFGGIIPDTDTDPPPDTDDTDVGTVLSARSLGSTPGSWHDGMDVDACGNVYIIVYNNSNLYRMEGDGVPPTLIFDWAVGRVD